MNYSGFSPTKKIEVHKRLGAYGWRSIQRDKPAENSVFQFDMCDQTISGCPKFVGYKLHTDGMKIKREMFSTT